jgi:hypothetical protein
MTNSPLITHSRAHPTRWSRPPPWHRLFPLLKCTNVLSGEPQFSNKILGPHSQLELGSSLTLVEVSRHSDKTPGWYRPRSHVALYIAIPIIPIIIRIGAIPSLMHVPLIPLLVYTSLSYIIVGRVVDINMHLSPYDDIPCCNDMSNIPCYIHPYSVACPVSPMSSLASYYPFNTSPSCILLPWRAEPAKRGRSSIKLARAEVHF